MTKGEILGYNIYMIWLETSRNNSENAKRLLAAGEFYRKYLKINKDYDIVVSFDPDTAGWYGYATFDEDGWYVEIALNPKRRHHDHLLTLAHEMVHARQYLSGDLKTLDVDKNICLWKGKKIKETDESYWNVPWEKEAQDLEYKLYNKMREKLGYLSLPKL